MAAISSLGKVASHVFCHTKTFYFLTPYNVISLPIDCAFFEKLVNVGVGIFLCWAALFSQCGGPVFSPAQGLLGLG